MPGPVARRILDQGRKAEPVKQAKQWPRVKLLDVHHPAKVVSSVRDQHGHRHGRHAGGVGNSLTSDLVVSIFVVRNVVDEDLDFRAILRAPDEVADAGFPGVVGRQRRGVAGLP